ncbi:MAG: hypothetical protein QOJ99_1199 [Bryobacterales bacterium]|jgi:hypothetical protein|nr:hypothetical protein [Bryobacterales bacterium]
MTSDLGTPVGHREIIRQINAQKAAEANAAGQHTHEERGPQRARITAFRDETTGQFYAMSKEDRAAFNAHCEGIIADLQPANHRERWLATSIAEDQWRLNRARALESNIFALGMSNPSIEVNVDSAEGHAAICQAHVWLADGKQLQALSLYESRIRRSIGKNEKQLKELQTERQAARQKALEDEILLAQLALMEGEIYVYEDSACRTYPGQSSPGAETGGHGFGFSSSEITRLARRELRLQEATRHRKQSWIRNSKHPKAA